MTWLGDRAARILGILCLLGQGILVYAGSGEGSQPGLAGPSLFLALTLIQAVALAFVFRARMATSPPTSRSGLLLLGGVLLLSVGVMLACSLVFLVGGDQAPTSGEGRSLRLEPVREALARYPAAVDRLLADTIEEIQRRTSPPVKGDWFRLVEPLPGQWSRYFTASRALPISVLVHGEGLLLAWTDGAEPFANPVSPASADRTETLFSQHNGSWFLRSFRSTPTGEVIEIQVVLDAEQQAAVWPGVHLVVSPTSQAPVLVDDQGNAVMDVPLQDAGEDLAVIPRLDPIQEMEKSEAMPTRVMLVLVAGWFLTLLLGSGLAVNSRAALAALWLGRALLAGVEYFRWFPQAFPHLPTPAAPDHLISLVGPAYFATPFAAGWFASTADALLTALVLGVTTWYLLRRMDLVGLSGKVNDRLVSRGMLRQGPLSGFLFGVTAVGTLWLLRFFVGMVAENANPRLIGQGVSLGFLSFWGLHIVLMVISFSLAALLTGWAASRPWPGREGQRGWLAGAALAALVGCAAFLFLPHDWTGLPALAGLAVGLLWMIAPAFRSRPRFLRRFAWPAVLLLVVIWNYASLRQVYDSAERNWLVAKGQLITSTGEGWTRFLLEDVLQGMQEADDRLPEDPAAVGIWRDYRAYQLWQGSPLGDLGYACAVEILDEDPDYSSYFATGFMRESGYELVTREIWTDRDGEPADSETILRYQSERRDYPGGEEEILTAEIPRLNSPGNIRVMLPVRSWRISTLLADLRDEIPAEGGYRPRSEIDRPILLLRGSAEGWLGTGDPGFTGASTNLRIQELKEGVRQWAVLHQGSQRWLCRWNDLPDPLSRAEGEGFLLGLARSGPVDSLLDLSRVMLINLVLLFLFFGLFQTASRLSLRLRNVQGEGEREAAGPLLPGFQERFLAGYLVLGLLLLLVVGMSVDRVIYQRVRADARLQTREGLNQTVSQLRSLLAEQARALASSEYIFDLLVREMPGQRPVGSPERRQAMVYGADGNLLLDETLSDLTEEEAASLLAAGRSNPLVVIRDDLDIYVATIIPLDLSGVYEYLNAQTGENGEDLPFPTTRVDGFFLYRQQLDQNLLNGLADLARGQATLYLDGEPFLASHPGPVFNGRKSLLTEAEMMASLLDHPGGPGVFPRSDRPFAFTGSQPVPTFDRDENGSLIRRPVPGVLSLAFPDREQQYMAQRRETLLFLTGLANLILLTALILALLMSWNLFRPLRLLLTATRSLAEGDFDAPLPAAGRDEVGRLTKAFGLMRSQLHSARERLAARERFLTTVLDQVTVGVAVLNVEGQVVALNPAGRHILADFQAQVGEEDAARRLLARFQELGAGHPRWGGEVRSDDGRRTLRGAMAPLGLDESEKDIMLVFEDITEFLQTKKLAINAELARQVAHEIKNPLTPIQLSIQLLDQAWKDQHPQLEKIVKETVRRVLGQVELLRSIASEFSLLGRPGELDLEALDLRALTAQVVEAYHGGSSGQEDAIQVIVAEGRLPLVMGEKDSLRKILGNLMQNSLDATRAEEPLRIQVSWQVDADSLTMIWSDNGHGLAAEVADRLFDPYFSTKSKGTGLGLAICRNLVDRMGGSMTLANRADGPGAVATLTLPLAS